LREADVAQRRALALKPDLFPAQLASAQVLLRSYRYADAETAARKALGLDARSPEAWLMLGEAQLELDRAAEAEQTFRAGLGAQPRDIELYRRLGNLLFIQGRTQELIAHSRHMRQRCPDYFDVHVDLARGLLQAGELAEAADVFAQALALRPQDLGVRDSWLFCCNYLAVLSPQALFEHARAYGQHASAAATAYTQWNCERAPARLRVGVVSGDLRTHPVGYFLESVLGASDRGRIEWFAYATTRANDGLTARLQQQCSSFKVLAGLSAHDCARQIHDDAPHVLIDLAGHTAENRLDAFAWRPAPVQVSWLGYFATTGLAEMDYFLADRVGVPEPARQYFSEEVCYLPDTRLCFSVPEIAPDVAPAPAASKGFVTFGSFQVMRKLNDEVLAVWAEVLHGCARSRLRIQSDGLSDEAVCTAFRARAQRLGIDPARLDLHPSESRTSYLQSHAHVDILLDSFPFPGGTTTCEALWMGVPTVTLAGATLVARQGASLLSAAGLPDWIAESRAEFIELALAKAADIDALQQLRMQLRERVRGSPLFDAPKFARNLDAALWQLWSASPQALLTEGATTG